MAKSAHRSGVSQALALGKQLRHIGQRLRDAGLTERATRTCFDVRCVGHAPLRVATMAPPQPAPPAAVLPWLFVAGKPLPTETVRARLAEDFDTLSAVGLIDVVDDITWASVAILPVGESLSVSDLADRQTGADLVLLPDDSAFHLIGALPRRAIRSWLDIGTGNAIAPLAARPGCQHVLGSDINRRALEYAVLGTGLSGAGEVELCNADLFEGVPDVWHLVTFNAPIPGEVVDGSQSTPTYLRAQPGAQVLERFWREVPRYVADDGEVLVHSWQQSEGYLDQLDLPGELVVARYTPDSAASAFGITRWRPGAKPRRHLRRVALSAAEPHVTRAHLEW